MQNPPVEEPGEAHPKSENLKSGSPNHQNPNRQNPQTANPQTASSQPANAPPESPRPLFVVDPRQDLAAAQDLLATYRRRVPEATVLEGPAATREAFRAALGRARWLHLDAHGDFDEAVPELSSLRLADGPLTLVELATASAGLEAANLSSCDTGRWPVTADSGRYGLAGSLARGGVRWVVGSRWELDDDLARGFNAAFYQALAEGEPWPRAYHRALTAVRRQHPPQRWATLLLLEAPLLPEAPVSEVSLGGGESDAVVTPFPVEENDHDLRSKETP